jgi:hypothetical protein
VPVRVNACAGLGGRAGLCFGEVRSDVPASLTQSSSSASVVLMERHFMTAPNDCEQSEWGYEATSRHMQPWRHAFLHDQDPCLCSYCAGAVVKLAENLAQRIFLLCSEVHRHMTLTRTNASTILAAGSFPVGRISSMAEQKAAFGDTRRRLRLLIVHVLMPAIRDAVYRIVSAGLKHPSRSSTMRRLRNSRWS